MTIQKDWTIPEQVYCCNITELTLEFKVSRDGYPELHISGVCLPFGNRSIGFNIGEIGEAYAGTFTGGGRCNVEASRETLDSLEEVDAHEEGDVL